MVFIIRYNDVDPNWRGRIPRWILPHVEMAFVFVGAKAVDVLPCGISRGERHFVRRETNDFAVLIVQCLHVVDSSSSEEMSRVWYPRYGVDPWSWNVMQWVEVKTIDDAASKVGD